jgi:Tfp pilus assembly protein PilX
VVATPQWNSANWAGATTRVYGVGSGAGAYTGDVASVPRYIIEVLPDLDPTPGNALNKKSSSSSTGGGTAFRITARGWGLRPGTQVELQSVYLKQ